MNHIKCQAITLVTCVAALTACSTPSASLDRIFTQPSPSPIAQNQETGAGCKLVESGYGSSGVIRVRVEEVASGLETPWGIVFLPDGSLMVSEREGRIRLVKNGQLQAAPLTQIPAVDQGEGGLLGLALHPNFAQNRWFYVYYTTLKNGDRVNRVERWQMAEDQQSAESDRVIIDNIPVAQYHNGGRIRFGPDGMLYVGTGDARQPDLSQNPSSLAGKILRLTPQGEVPADNPSPGNPVYISGIRNTQGFDWLDASTLWVTDHGPSGELGLSGLDEVSLAKAGDNLGWPRITGCDRQDDLIQPVLSWRNAAPPGGAAVYTGTAIPEWRGSLLIGTLRSTHLQRVALNAYGQLERHEVYLQGEAPEGYGRLREVVMGTDNQLYVTTSNCDGRGVCPPEKDKILRITR
jgi:aldose sugar dehydrogenase